MKYHRFLTISFLLITGLTVCAAQEEYPLTVQDLQACLTDKKIEVNKKRFDRFSKISIERTQDFFKDRPRANHLMGELEKVTDDQNQKTSSLKSFLFNVRNTYLEHHVVFLLTHASLKKEGYKLKESIDKENKLDDFSSVFFNLGCYITKQISQNTQQDCEQKNNHQGRIDQFVEYVKKDKFDESDVAAADVVSGYINKLNDTMNSYFSHGHDLDQYTRVMRSALGLEYQNLFNKYNKVQEDLYKKYQECAQKKDYQKRAITNGKRVAAGLGIVAAFTAMTAWVWSFQASR